MDTPLFPDFEPDSGPFRRCLQRIRKASLSQLEYLFGCFLPAHLLSQADDGPTMVHKESLAFLIAHNLLRTIMAEAASVHGVRLERISFKGTVDAVRQFGVARAQARNKQQRLRLDEELLRVLADDLVPEQPVRREPRAVKRRPKPYPLLTSPRHQYKELPHRNRYKAPKKPGN